MTPHGFIYITTCLTNGKRYLGMCAYHRNNSSTYLGSGKALRRAIKKYGSDAFTREIIEECATKDDMIAAEIRYIAEYNCVKDKSWYNINGGGYATKGFTGKTHSEETKELMRKNYKRPMTDSTMEKFRENGTKRSGALRKHREDNPDFQNKALIFANTFYPSIGECVNATGLAWNTVVSRIKKPPRSVMAFGVVYHSIHRAAKELGVDYKFIKRRLLDESNTDVVLHTSVYKFL